MRHQIAEIVVLHITAICIKKHKVIQYNHK